MEMRTRCRFAFIAFMLVVQLLAVSTSGRAADTLPAQLTDSEFWKLATEFSEPDGTFRSDNLLSNESYFQFVIPPLMQVARTGNVYMGVGPEQNFTYIAALKPKMVFILDIRRGNLDLHLLYKALFELSENRADFVFRLFARKRPDGIGPESSVEQIFRAVETAQTSNEIYAENLQAIKDHLIKKHGFALSENDLGGIEWVYSNFQRYGPYINYGSSGRGGFGGNGVTYADLMTANDGKGTSRSYLASEENFNFLKSLEVKNLIVPVVGNFAGPKAIRAVGKYVKEKQATIQAFYLSNVEMYLEQDGIWNDFCLNVATLPLDPASTFIRSIRGGRYGFGTGLNSDLGNIPTEVQACTPEK